MLSRLPPDFGCFNCTRVGPSIGWIWRIHYILTHIIHGDRSLNESDDRV